MNTSEQGSISAWHGFLDTLVRRRVKIAKALLLALLLRYLALGIRPRSLLDGGDLYVLAGSALLVCGVGLRSWAAGIVCKFQQVTTTGPYRLCRNPLYL